MRINPEAKTMDIEARDINYVLGAYLRNYLFYSHNEMPVKIVFPMFMSTPHPLDPRQQIEIEWVAALDEVAVEIAQDGSNVPEASEAHLAVLEEREDEILRLKAELAEVRAEPHDVINLLEDSVEYSGSEVQESTPDLSTLVNLAPEQPAFVVGSSTVLPSRVPNPTPGGELPAGSGSPDNMGSRDARADRQLARDLGGDDAIEEDDERPK